MAYQPLKIDTPARSSSGGFIPESYKPLDIGDQESISALRTKIEEDAIVFASEPEQKKVSKNLFSFFKSEPKVEQKSADVVAYETYRQKNPVTAEEDTVSPQDFASRDEYQAVLRGSAEVSKKQYKGLLKGTLDELPEGSRKVSKWLDNLIINKPAELLADSDFKLIQRGENIPILRSIPGVGITPAKWFQETADGLEYARSDEKDNLGLEVLETTKFGAQALSGLTGGLYTPEQAAPENMAQKIFKGASEIVGTLASLKVLGSGLGALALKPKGVATFINAYPKLSKFAIPYLINTGAFTAYGQLNPALAGDFKARMKQMSFDAVLSVPFTGLGFTSAKVSVPAITGLTYGLAKMSGASNEDAMISAITIGVLDALGRRGGFGRHGAMDGKQAQKIMDVSAREVLGVGKNATPEQIKTAYRKLARENHPDLGGDSKKMAEINSAFDFLTGENKTFQKTVQDEVKTKQNEQMKRDTGIEVLEAPKRDLVFGEKPKTEVKPDEVKPAVSEERAVEVNGLTAKENKLAKELGIDTSRVTPEFAAEARQAIEAKQAELKDLETPGYSDRVRKEVEAQKTRRKEGVVFTERPIPEAKSLGKLEPIREVAGEKIKVPTAKSAYDRGRIIVGELNGKKYTTDTFLIEFEDIGLEKSSLPVPAEEAVKGIVEKAKTGKDLTPSEVLIPKSGFGNNQVILTGAKDEIVLDAKYYNYLSKKYKNLTLKGSDPKSPIGIYEGKDLKGVVMPVNQRIGKGNVRLSQKLVQEKPAKKPSTEPQKEGKKPVVKSDIQEEKGVKGEVRRTTQDLVQEVEEAGVDRKKASQLVTDAILAKSLGDFLKSPTGDDIFTDTKITEDLGGAEDFYKHVQGSIKTARAVEKRGLKALEEINKTPSGDAFAIYKPEDLPDFPVMLGGIKDIKPIQFPELVSLAKELMGQVPTIVKKTGNAAGRFISGGGKDTQIKLVASLFESGNAKQASMVLAHELGHLIDYLPDRTLKRGNLLGRLQTLRNFLKSTFDTEAKEGVDLKTERDRISKEVVEDEGFTFGDMVSGKLPQEVKDRIKREYALFKENPNFIKDVEVKAELMKVTEYWRPWDPKKVPESYNAYRKSSRELYADAISMLFNSPGLLEKMAPKFYKELFNALDNKPEVKKQFFDLQDLLTLGEDAVLSKREKDIREMFRKGEDLYKVKVAEREQRGKSYVSRLRYELIDKNEALIQLMEKTKKEGGHVNDDENPIYYLEEHNYVGGKIKNFVETGINPVYKRVQEAGATWEDFGVVLFLRRVMTERGDLANPLGQTPETAEAQLKDLSTKIGNETFEVLTKEADVFRDAIKEVMQQGYDAGLYKPELYQNMIENPAYATFQVLDYLQEFIPASIKKQMGTLKEISNPATATVIKTISTIRAIERNIVRKKAIDFLQKFQPDEIKPAKKIFNGKTQVPVESKEVDEELLTYMDKGQVEGVYVDPYIAKSFERNTVGQNNAVIQTLRLMNSNVFRPLFITYNPGFQAFNLLRDFQRAWKNTPGMTLFQLVKLYKDSYKSAKARAYNLPDETIREMEKSGILSVTYNDLVKGREEIDDQIQAIMRNYDLLEKPKAKSNPALKIVMPILDFIERTGNLVETLPKVAGYKAMNGKLPPKELGSFIRTRIGSPDFLRRGAGYGWYNEVFLFSNAIKEGIRGDYASAITDPRTRSGWWWKTAKREFVPKLLMLAGLLGIFGDDIKEMFEGVSSYDMTNYTIIPLGKDKNGKSIYIRVPHDETSRLVAGLFWKGLNLPKDGVKFSDVAEIASYTGGQLPSFSPSLTAAFGTSQFLAGQNPYDFFRGRNVLTETEFEAGGKYALIPFMKWQFQQLGGGTLMRFNIREGTPTEGGVIETSLKAPIVSNVIGRFLKISDYGITEKNNEIKAEVDQERARERIKENEIINKYIKQFQKDGANEDAIEDFIGQATKEAFKGQVATKREVLAFQKKMKMSIVRGESDPNVNALIYAESNDAKVALLKQYKENLDDEEFADLFKFVQEQKIVSTDAAKKFISSQ